MGRALPVGHEVAGIHDYLLSRGRFRRVVVNSRMMGRELAARYAIDPTKIEVSYPGYDPRLFNPETACAERLEMRHEIGIEEDEWLIGLITSGNFRKRNVAGLVNTAARLERRCPGRFRFLVVGRDDPAPYQQQAGALGVAEQLLWQATVADVEKLYGALDLFMLPAHVEEFGCVALEAMACATPVLLSSQVGCAELLQSEHSSLILDPEDIAAWASRIEALSGDVERSRQIGASLARIATGYSHPVQREKLSASFAGLCRGEEQKSRSE